MNAAMLTPDEEAFEAWLKSDAAQAHAGQHMAFDPKVGPVASSPQLYGLVAQLRQRPNLDRLLSGAITDSSILIINLAPLESECRVCGRSLLNIRNGSRRDASAVCQPNSARRAKTQRT